MVFDSHIERRASTSITLGLPRWYKRISYYIFKIRYLQHNKLKLNGVPGSNVRLLLINRHFTEYEVYVK
jgi:hypothetical protein